MLGIYFIMHIPNIRHTASIIAPHRIVLTIFECLKVHNKRRTKRRRSIVDNKYQTNPASWFRPFYLCCNKRIRIGWYFHQPNYSRKAGSPNWIESAWNSWSNRKTFLASTLQRKFKFDAICHQIQTDPRKLEKRYWPCFGSRWPSSIRSFQVIFNWIICQKSV